MKNQFADHVPLNHLISEDLTTHENNVLSPGFLALAAHRLAREARGRSKALQALSGAAQSVVELVYGIKIPRDTYVGRRVHIWHFGSMVLNAEHIGNDVHIRHATTFGPLTNKIEGRPIIGDRVEIGAGACVLGAITVDDGAKVGTNSVVIENVKKDAVVFGVPARVMK